MPRTTYTAGGGGTGTTFTIDTVANGAWHTTPPLVNWQQNPAAAFDRVMTFYDEARNLDPQMVQYLSQSGLLKTPKMPPNKPPAPERTDGMTEDKYFRLTEKTLMVYNWFNPESSHKFEYRFSLEGINQSSEQIESTMRKAINEFRQHYGSLEQLDAKVASSFLGIVDKPTDVFLNINLPAYSIDLLIAKLNSSISNLDNAIQESRKWVEISIVQEHPAAVAEYMYRGNEAKIKFLMLQEVIDALVAVKEGSLDAAFLRENNNIVDYCLKALDSLAIKTNNGHTGRNAKDNETKWQYKLSSLKKRSGEESVHALAHRHEINNIYHARQERMRGERGCIRITKFKPESKADFKLSLRALYPTLKSELKGLKRNVYHTPFRPEYGIHVDYQVLRHHWDNFNKIKNNLMFLGLKEFDIVQMMDRVIFKSGVNICDMTKQYLPKCFLVPVKVRVPLDRPETLVCNAYYLHSLNGGDNGNMRHPRFAFNVNPSMVIENKISLQSYYHSGVKNHTYNPLTFLSPKAMTSENVQVYGNNRTFRPVPYLGVELEVERKEGYRTDNTGKILTDNEGNPLTVCVENISEHVYNLLGRDFVLLKRDGSLGGHNPFEIVTAPATLQYHQMKWKGFLENKEFKNQLQSYHSGNCGMHVHISRDSFNGLHLAKFMRFMNLKDNYNFVTKVAQRAANRYSVFAEKTLKENLELIHGPERMGRDEARRVAVNCTNTNTIEVRIFRGNLSKVAFLKNLEFVHAVWAYTKDASIADLNYKQFIYWLFDTKNDTKFYKHLKVWLVSAGWNVSNIKIQSVADEQKAKKIKKMQLIVDRKYTPNNPTLKFGCKEPLTKDDILASA